MARLIHGLGVNDIKEATEQVISGKRRRNRDYACWVGMINRCYYNGHPAYDNKTVCTDWKYFSNFKLWFNTQVYYEGLQLDKDIIFKGNTEYSPLTCAFVPTCINTLLGNGGSKEDRKLPLGVAKKGSKYRADIQEFGTGKAWLGSFFTAKEAHKAWQWSKARQIEKAVAWYVTQKCFRIDVAEALTKRVWQLRLDHTTGVETLNL